MAKEETHSNFKLEMIERKKEKNLKIHFILFCQDRN